MAESVIRAIPGTKLLAYYLPGGGGVLHTKSTVWEVRVRLIKKEDQRQNRTPLTIVGQPNKQR